MQQKYLDRIKEMSEIEQAYDGIDDMFPTSKESIKSLEYVLDILEAMEMIDRIDPNNNIYPDNDGGVEIVYTTDDLYSVVIDVKDNFIVLSSYNKDECVLYISDDKYTPIKIANKIGKYVDYVENRCDKPLCSKWASITIDIYDEGLRFKCDDIGKDIFIKAGDAETFIKELNLVCDICDPESRFSLTEKGREYLKQLQEL
jgi:hypothetical protein